MSVASQNDRSPQRHQQPQRSQDTVGRPTASTNALAASHAQASESQKNIQLDMNTLNYTDIDQDFLPSQKIGDSMRITQSDANIQMPNRRPENSKSQQPSFIQKKSNSIFMPAVKTKLNQSPGKVFLSKSNKVSRQISKTGSTTGRISDLSHREKQPSASGTIVIMQSNGEFHDSKRNTSVKKTNSRGQNAHLNSQTLKNKAYLFAYSQGENTQAFQHRPKFVDKNYLSSVQRESSMGSNSIHQETITDGDESARMKSIIINDQANSINIADVANESFDQRQTELPYPRRRFPQADATVFSLRSNQYQQTMVQKKQSGSSQQPSKNLAMYQNDSTKQKKTRNSIQQHITTHKSNVKAKKQAAHADSYLSFRGDQQHMISSKTVRKIETEQFDQSQEHEQRPLPLPSPINNHSHFSSTDHLQSMGASTYSINLKQLQSNETQYELARAAHGINSDLKCPVIQNQQRAQQIQNVYKSQKSSLTNTQHKSVSRALVNGGTKLETDQMTDSSAKLTMPVLFQGSVERPLEQKKLPKKLSKINTPRNQPANAEYRTSVPRYKNKSKVHNTETQGGQFECHFTVTKDDSADRRSVQQSPESRGARNGDLDHLKDTNPKLNLNPDQNMLKLQDQHKKLHYGTISNMNHQRALRQKRLHDVYVQNKTKFPSPGRNRSNSQISKNITPQATYASGFNTGMDQYPPSNKMLQTQSSNIRIINDNSLQNSTEDLRESMQNLQSQQELNEKESTHLRDLGLKGSTKLEPILGSSRYAGKYAEPKSIQKGYDTRLKSIKQSNEGAVPGGDANQASTSTLLLGTEGQSLAGSIERTKKWKNSHAKLGRPKQANAARNQSNHFVTTKERDAIVYSEFPYIKKSNNYKNGSDLKKRSSGQQHSLGVKNMSPDGKTGVKSSFKQTHEAKQMNSSRVSSMTGIASKSLAPPSKLSTMDNFHRQANSNMHIRKSFSNAKYEVEGNILRQETGSGVGTDHDGELLHLQSEQINSARKSSNFEVVNKKFKPSMKKQSGTMLNVSSVTSLPKLDSRTEKVKIKRQSVDEGKEDIRRTSQRVKSIDRGLEQQSNRHRIVKVEKLTKTRLSLQQKQHVTQNHSSLKNKDGNSSNFNSPKLRKQVSIKAEHELIGNDTASVNDYETNQRGQRRQSQNLQSTVDCIKEFSNEYTGNSTTEQRGTFNNVTAKTSPKSGLDGKRENQNDEILKVSSLTLTDSNLEEGQNQSPQAKIVSSSNHQIRIEIGKQEVLDNMSKEYKTDLSLLYYDFNNSTARLVSKQKKLLDFVIQEENEDIPKTDNEVARDAGSSPQKQYSSMQKAQQMPSPTFEGSKSLAPSKSYLTHSQSLQMQKTESGMDQNSEVNQSDFERVNRKISKAKLSLGQLQPDGIGIGLQSPARLANSRNSNNNSNRNASTDDQLKLNSARPEDTESPKINAPGLFMFNNKAANGVATQQRMTSPLFGSQSKTGEQPTSGSFAGRATQMMPHSNTHRLQESQISIYDGTIMSNNSGSLKNFVHNGGGTGATELQTNLQHRSMQSHEVSVIEESKTNFGGGTGFPLLTRSDFGAERTSARRGTEENLPQFAADEKQMTSSDDRHEEQNQTFHSVLHFVKENPTIWQ